MSPPESSWSREELELLRSASLDGPAPDAHERVLAAVGVGGAVLGGAMLGGSAQLPGLLGAAPSGGLLGAAAGSGKALLGVKVLGALIAAGAVGGAVVRYRAPSTPERTTVATSVPNESRHRGEPSAVPAAREMRAPAASPDGSEAVTAVPSVTRASPPPAASRTEPDILQEIAALDRARRASERGDFAAALAELDAHDRDFKRGRLRPEALLLRIQTLIDKGDVRSARSLGARFLAKYPKSPLSPRIQKLIGSN